MQGDDVLSGDERVHVEAEVAAVAARVRGGEDAVSAREDVAARHALHAALRVRVRANPNPNPITVTPTVTVEL